MRTWRSLWRNQRWAAGPRFSRGRWPLLVGAVALLSLLAAKGCGASATSASVEDGRRLYRDACVSCHGEAGTRIPVAPLDSAEFLNSRGDATLMAVIAEGKGVMPAFSRGRGGPFSDSDVRSVLAYVSSKAGRTSSSLLADDGRAVFQASCARCHGERGDRIPAAPLNAKGFLDSRTDSELVRVMAEGKGLMPAFGKAKGGSMPDERIRAVVAYLRHNVDAEVSLRARLGRELYVGNCLACHGERGDRVPSVGLAASSYLSGLGDGALISAINEGKGVMSAYGSARGGPFGIPETAAMLAYLKSWSGLSATSALTGPEQAGAGRDLFLRNCTPCHGDTGDRVPGIQLKSQAFLVNQTDRVLRQTILQGNAKGMPAWGKSNGGPLSDEQIDSILQYLKSSAPGGLGGAAAVAVTVAPATTPAAASPSPAVPPASASPTSGPAVLDASLANKGKAIFSKNCAACHGETRDKIATCQLASKTWLTQKGAADLVRDITEGKPPMMPAWGKNKGGSLSDDEIKAVASYVWDAAGAGGAAGEGTPTPKPAAAAAGAAPAPATPPGGAGGAAGAAAVSKGKDIFTKNCVACHGESRDMQPNCKLADKTWLAQKGDVGLVNAITRGKPGTMMPAWEGKIAPEDVKAVVAYLKDAAGAGGGSSALTPVPSPNPSAGSGGGGVAGGRGEGLSPSPPSPRVGGGSASAASRGEGQRAEGSMMTTGEGAPLRIRLATDADSAAINRIYNHYVEHSTATFEIEPVTLAARREWLAHHGDRFPVTVAEAGGEVVGWCSLSPFHERPAYRFTVEDSIYVLESRRGQAIGGALLADMLERARALGYHAVVARIGDSANEVSRRLHAGQGFALAGVEREVGFKFGRWLDVVVMVWHAQR